MNDVFVERLSKIMKARGINQKELSSLNITAGRYAMPVSSGLVI